MIIRTHKWPAPNVSSFSAQLVRASHWYREVTGLNPVEVLTFSRPQPLFPLRAGRMPLYLLSYGSTALSASSFYISLFFLVLHQRVNPAKQPWVHAFLLWSHHIRLYFSNPQQILLRDRLTTQVKKKAWNIDPKLAAKQCCATSSSFLHLIFCRLYRLHNLTFVSL